MYVFFLFYVYFQQYILFKKEMDLRLLPPTIMIGRYEMDMSN